MVVHGHAQAVAGTNAAEELEAAVWLDVVAGLVITNMNVIVTLQTDCVFGKHKTVDILYMYIIKQNAFYWEYFLLLFWAKMILKMR